MQQKHAELEVEKLMLLDESITSEQNMNTSKYGVFLEQGGLDYLSQHSEQDYQDG